MAVARDVFEREVLVLLPSLLGVARRLTRNHADAEDLVAETVVRAWKSLESLKCEAAFRGWLFRILNNAFLSDWRRAQVRPQFDTLHDEEEEDVAQFSLFEQMHQPFLLWFGNPEQAFLDKLLRDDIERALAALPEHHRVVVLLADVEELSYGEIAEVLDIRIGTVRSRLARARGTLQKLLWQQAQGCGLYGQSVARAAASGEGRQP